MNEQDFTNIFIATFLTTWCATNYEDYCIRGKQEDLGKPPVEDAVFLAAEAWHEYDKD